MDLQGGSIHQRDGSYKIAYQNTPYVDVLSSGAANAFIITTHEQYKARFGRYFGNVIKGFYMDEPGFYAGLFGFVDKGTFPYTGDFLDEFEKRQGFDLRPFADALWDESKPRLSAFVRVNYFQTLSELY